MIVREIVEREVSNAPPAPPKAPSLPSSQKHGFPAPRRRNPQAGPSRPRQASTLDAPGPSRQAAPSAPANPNVTSRDGEQFPHLNFAQPFHDRLSQSDELQRQMEEENKARVESMTEEEREQEREELVGRFGGGLVALMRRRKEQREREKAGGAGPDSTVKMGDAGSGSRVQSGSPAFPSKAERPERQQERNQPSEEAKLAWMESTSSTSDPTIRFDLSGSVLSEEAKASIPTSAGLHHHGASPDLAGYSIDDILWLSRSTVPSQRITMLGVLGRVLGRYHAAEFDVEVTQALDNAKAKHKGIEMAVDILLRPGSSVGLLKAGVDLLYEALGGRMWTWLDDEPSRYRPDRDEAGVEAVPFQDLAPRIKEMLGPNTTLPDGSMLNMLRILRRATLHSQDLAEQVASLIPALIAGRVVSATTNTISLEAMRLLVDTIKTSRQCAEAVVDAGIPTQLSRFLIPQTWDDGDHEMCELALSALSSLGRYGLAAGFVTSTTEIIRSLGQWVKQTCARPSSKDSAGRIVERYFDCLTVWTTCAIDPHKTTPEHALTWAQVSSMDWSEEAVSALASLTQHEGRCGEIAAALGLCDAWLAGAKINGQRGGQDEIRALLDGVRGTDLTRRLLDEGPGAASSQMVERALRLDNADDTGILSPETRQTLVDRCLKASAPGVRYQALRAAQRALQTQESQFVDHAFEILQAFQPGNEPDALDLMDELLRREMPGNNTIDHPDKLQILRPLLHYAILPGAESVVGPNRPLHTHLKVTTTLRLLAARDLGQKRTPGLPLAADWTFSPLDVLLDSASSPALAQAPPDWTPSEVDLVRASLVLAKLGPALPRSTLLFNLMKVYMLEHNSQSSGPHIEVFRDEVVSQFISDLLAQTTTPNTSASAETMETAAIPFLGPETPFYSWYSDFLTLYEAISYGDKSFSRLVLAPLAMHYPVDYRKLLWVEHATALRSLRVGLTDLPLEGGGIEAYFLPGERDRDVLAGYLRAVIAGWVTARSEALWRIAVWHLAEGVWGGDDGEEVGRAGGEAEEQAGAKEEGKTGGREEVKQGLLGGLIQAAPEAVLREVMGLAVGPTNVGVWDRTGDEVLKERLGVVEGYFGLGAREKVARLFPHLT